MRFVISRAGVGERTYRAFCYSLVGENEVETSYTESQLVAEIARLKLLRQPAVQQVAALNRLRGKNSGTGLIMDRVRDDTGVMSKLRVFRRPMRDLVGKWGRF